MQQAHLKVSIIGREGVGKSWLANRLIKILEGDTGDYERKIFGEQEQLFKERSEKEVIGKDLKKTFNSLIQHSYLVGSIQITEILGFNSIPQTPWQNQIETIKSESADIFIYVQNSQYSLQQEHLIELQKVSQMCTPKKLYIFLSEYYNVYFDKENQQWNYPDFYDMLSSWKQQKDMYAEDGLHYIAWGLGYELRKKSDFSQPQNQQSNQCRQFQENVNSPEIRNPRTYHVLIISSSNKLTQQISDLSEYQIVNKSAASFDVVIVDYDKMGRYSWFKFGKSKSKQQMMQILSESQIFKAKGILYFNSLSHQGFLENNNNLAGIDYMKENLSIETLRNKSQNIGTIKQEDLRDLHL